MQEAALTWEGKPTRTHGPGCRFVFSSRCAIVMTTLTQCAFSMMLLLTLWISVWSHQHSRV